MQAKNIVKLALGAAFSLAATDLALSRDGLLKFFNTHTRETVTADIDTAAGRSRANNILRDHRRGEAASMDTRLLSLLDNIKHRIEAKKPGLDVTFHIISGYRSPVTNETLRKTPGRGGQAKNSLHMKGDAIDIRVPGISTRELRDIAWCAQGGGVGYYPDSAFVHVDVGNIRTWPGAWERGIKCG